MTRPTTERLGAGRYLATGGRPQATTTSVHELATADGATVYGVLATVPGASTVVCLMHPRQDVTHHPMIPVLLNTGVAVWTQGARSVNNDLALIHEQALLDAAAGQVFLRERGFGHVVTLGLSGGGTLFAFYHEQAGLPPTQRIARTPAGRPTGLAEVEMPLPDGAVFVAPHPGQGALLMRMIDPSVADETDPLSVDQALNPFNPANGFVAPPQSSHYSPEFVERYRGAQRERVARLDELARRRVADVAAARGRFRVTDDPADRRAALAPRILTVYRTDADLRNVDLGLDPNDRPYGSLFGRRPDLTDYGLVGFGRLATPDAWLSTWSGLSSNADFLRCAPGVTAPSLFIELTGDQAAFPAESRSMSKALGSQDRTVVAVRGTHFGGSITPGEPAGNELAGREIGGWLAARHPLAPPG